MIGQIYNRVRSLNSGMTSWRGISIGMTREQVAALLGRPDDVGGTSRKYPEPSIYRYGKYELHFGPRADDTLFLIYAEDGDGNGQTILR